MKDTREQEIDEIIAKFTEIVKWMHQSFLLLRIVYVIPGTELPLR